MKNTLNNRKFPERTPFRLSDYGTDRTAVVLVAASVLLTWLSLVLAYANYPEEVYAGYFENALLLRLNWFPIAVLMGLLWALTGRATLSYVLTALLVIGGGIGNCFKLKFRGDPVIFTDIALISTAYDVGQSYEMELTVQMKLVIGLAVAGALLVFLLLRKQRASLRERGTVAVLILLSVLCVWPRYYMNEDVYRKYTANPAMNNYWETTDFYVSKGFVYPVFYSLNDIIGQVPEGYNAKAEAKAWEAYSSADIPEERKVNLIAFQLEAFTDLRDVGVEGIHEDVYKDYDLILSESYSGTLMTNIFAGGTTDTEWSFLTGYTDIPKFYSNTNSYVWYLKEQGYVTGGSHPCYSWYYDRININPRLGFDDYLFMENHYKEFDEDFPTFDYQAVPEMLRLYREAAAGEEPVFHFNVTYQGHGPYYTHALPHGDHYWDPTGYYEDVTEYTRYILNNYLWSMQDTSKRMINFLNELRYEEEPVVVLLYGDHKPWLGDYESCYTELGIDVNVSKMNGMVNYYGTEYVIWANEAAKAVLGDEFKGEGPTVGVTFLMNELFAKLGWEGDAHMQMMEEVRSELQTVSSIGYYIDGDRLLFDGNLSEEQKALLDDMMNAQYYWKKHFVYGTD